MKVGIANNVVVSNVSLLLIAFTLPSFYAIGLWLGTNITLSTTSTEVIPKTLRSGINNANFNNDNDQTPTIDLPLVLKQNIGQIKTLKSINLIGERNSGTKWITSHLTECFGDQIIVNNRYTRWKHWFQYDDDKDKKYHHPFNSSLVVSMFRNPYDWVNSMIKKPYHAPKHHNMNWKEFVTTPWTMGYRGEGDKDILRAGKQGNATCLHRFSFNEIIPCSESDRRMNFSSGHVAYELKHDGSGDPYNSILELRRDKVKNFLSVANFKGVAAFIPVQYEHLTSRGTHGLIGKIENITGLEARCKESPPGLQRPKELDDEYVRWMSAHIDWEVEKLIGYSRRDP